MWFTATDDENSKHYIMCASFWCKRFQRNWMTNTFAVLLMLSPPSYERSCNQKNDPTTIPSTKKITIITSSYLGLGCINSSPPIKGLNGSGIMTEPSSCWLFSSMHTIIRGTAQAVAFNVWTNCGGARLLLPFLGFVSAGSEERNLIPRRRLW